MDGGWKDDARAEVDAVTCEDCEGITDAATLERLNAEVDRAPVPAFVRAAGRYHVCECEETP